MDEYISKLNDYRKQDGKPLSQKSQETYIRNLRNLTTKYGWDFSITKLDEYLSQFSQSQHLNYYNSIMNYLSVMGYEQSIIDVYKNHRDKLRTDTPYQMSQSKKDNCCEWDEIIKWRNHIIEENNMILKLGKVVPLHKLQLEALLRLYTTYQRRNEYADLVFFDDTMPIPEHDNLLFYDTTKNSLYLMLGDFKTKDKYGKQILEITDTEENLNTKTFLLSYIIQNERNPIMFKTRALGRATEEKQLTRLNLTKLLNRSSKDVLGKLISTDRIRKAYNSKYAIMKKELLKDTINNAHSVETILKHYVL